MPKKTRKEKFLSQKRRESQSATPVITITERKESVHEQAKISVSPAKISLSNEETNIRKYFENDLRKSLLIIGAIFALEFFFYFATMNNYLSRYLNF